MLWVFASCWWEVLLTFRRNTLLPSTVSKWMGWVTHSLVSWCIRDRVQNISLSPPSFGIPHHTLLPVEIQTKDLPNKSQEPYRYASPLDCKSRIKYNSESPWKSKINNLFIPGFFNVAFNIRNHLSYRRMKIIEKRIENNVDRNGHDLILGTIPTFLEELRKIAEASCRITCLWFGTSRTRRRNATLPAQLLSQKQIKDEINK